MQPAGAMGAVLDRLFDIGCFRRSGDEVHGSGNIVRGFQGAPPSIFQIVYQLFTAQDHDVVFGQEVHTRRASRARA